MKTLRTILFTIIAFVAVSCDQLNLDKTTGSISIRLPESNTTSRAIIGDGKTIHDYEGIKFKISLLSSSETVAEQSASQNDKVEFNDLAIGYYTLEGLCFVGDEDVIAKGSIQVEVKAGEKTEITLPLYCNAIENLVADKSAISYSGKTEFDGINELIEFVQGGMKGSLSADLVFVSGWTETVYDGFECSVLETDDINKLVAIITYAGGILKKNVDLTFRQEEMSEEEIPEAVHIVDESKSIITSSRSGEVFDSLADFQAFGNDVWKESVTATIVYKDGTSEVVEGSSDKKDEFSREEPVKGETSGGITIYSVTVKWSRDISSVTQTLHFKVVADDLENERVVDELNSSLECLRSGEVFDSLADFQAFGNDVWKESVTATIVYTDGGTGEIVEGSSEKKDEFSREEPVKGETTDGLTLYSVTVKWSRGSASITQTFSFKVNEVGFYKEYPCVTLAQLKTALDKVSDNGTIYVQGDETTHQIEIGENANLEVLKNVTLASTVSDLKFVRTNPRQYIFIKSECTLTINQSESDNEITFTDKDGLTGVNYYLINSPSGNFTATNVKFTGINYGAVSVSNARLTKCSFTSNSCEVAAVNISSTASAVIAGCHFENNTNKAEADEFNKDYPDVYFTKYATNDLRISGDIDSTMKIYIANTGVSDSEKTALITVGTISFVEGTKLMIGATTAPASGKKLRLFSRFSGAVNAISTVYESFEFKTPGSSEYTAEKVTLSGQETYIDLSK